jgi:hypothetical protein
MRGLTPEDWKDHIVYLTRERPKTHMNGVVGGYLTKIIEAFDLDDIKEAYGGYEFSYIMKRGRDALYNGKFTVEAPPKLDAQRESANASENGGGAAIVQQFISMLREELERSRGAGGGDQTTTKAVEMLSKASEKAMDMIKQQVPEAGNPTSQLRDLLALAKEMGIFGGGGGGSNIIETIKTLKELGLIGQAAQNPMANLDAMLSVFTKLDELRGSSGGGGRRDWKNTLVDRGLEALPAVLDTLKQTRDASVQIAQERARAAESLRHVQPPSATPARPSVMTPRPAAAPTAAADPAVVASSGLRTVPIDRAVPIDQPGAEPAAAPAEVYVETIDRNSTAYVNLVKQTIVEMINRGDHGEQIVDYLDGAKPGFSNTLVQYPPEQLTAYLSLDPILREAVNHPNWSEVLDEARNYILDPGAPESGETEEEQELETATAGAGARRNKGKPN